MCANCIATNLAHSKYSRDSNHWWISLMIRTIVIISIMRLVSSTFKMYLEFSHSDLPFGCHTSIRHSCPLPGLLKYPSELSSCFYPFLLISETAARVIF